MKKIITLKVAAGKINVAQDIARDAYRCGLYDGLVRPTGIVHRDTLLRYGVELSGLPALLDATWEYVLYNNHGKRRRGPWVPSHIVAKWLQHQIALRRRARAHEMNPNIMSSLAYDLNIDDRRLHAWANASYQYIEYSPLEDALWAFGCMCPEDICSRDKMVISRPRPGKGKK